MLFDLPPALIGKLYQQKPISRSEEEWRIVAIDISQDTGLVFDESSQQLIGQPLLVGEHHVMIRYQAQLYQQWGETQSSYCLLVISPDPRSLWQNIPSDPQQLYAKPDSASQSIISSHIKMLAASQRGRSHAHKGQSREDDFFIAAGEHWQLAIVADGAGSAKYSRYGSQLICQTIGRFLSKVLTQPMIDIKLELKNALNEAVCALENEAAAQQVDVKDYASTVLAVLCYFDSQQQDYVYWTVAVGDGAIAWYQPQTEQMKLLNTPDTGDYAGETRFLSNDVLMQQNIINCYRSKAFMPCLLMTDGVSDAFFDSDNALKSHQVWRDLWQNLQKNQALDDDKNMLEWLDFWSRGNHDDRTLVLILGKEHG